MSDRRLGAAPETAISAHGLSKSFGRVQAVADVSLDVRRGEIYGFLGRNGAGKTTTIRMLLGLVRPDAGEISILGMSIRDARSLILSRIGFFVESPAAYPNLTVRENLRIQSRLIRSPASAVDEVIDLLQLDGYVGRRAGKLSLGNKQRLSLARALLGMPELLILDEPANGLDPAGIIEIRALLRRLANEKGVTIFMSSHLLDEVEHLADRVGIVHAGRLVEEMDYRTLRETGTLAIEVEVDDVARAERVLRNELGLTGLTRSGETALRVTDRSAKPAPIARALVGAGISLQRLLPMEEDLERHFMRLTGGEP
ncbi:MAG TPA: ABC transporter ATP-binding protein [Spirochaetia bacterium]|nr:ABC transporter ATP-binding protein [Spirochaetia bacterium]